MDSSPLSRLPAELRNQIYECVLVADGPIIITTATYIDRLRTSAHLSPSLLQVCKQINRETAVLFYNTNTFDFQRNFTSEFPSTELKILKRFAATVGPENRAALGQVILTRRLVTFYSIGGIRQQLQNLIKVVKRLGLRKVRYRLMFAGGLDRLPRFWEGEIDLGNFEGERKRIVGEIERWRDGGDQVARRFADRLLERIGWEGF